MLEVEKYRSHKNEVSLENLVFLASDGKAVKHKD